MAIVTGDLKLYQSANMPEADGATSGGAIATTGKAEIVDLSATDTVEALSDGADVRTCTVTGRLASGAIDSEALVLTGATPVNGAKSFKDILKVVMSGADGSRTVTVRKASDDVTICTLGPNITSQRRLFYDSASDSDGTVRYEKLFWKNEHGTLSLTAATLKLTADPEADYKIGGAPSVDDSATVSDRLDTAPASVTFVDDNVAQAVPGDGNLDAGEAIGIWVQQTLAASAAATDSSVTTELAGTTAA